LIDSLSEIRDQIGVVLDHLKQNWCRYNNNIGLVVMFLRRIEGLKNNRVKQFMEQNLLSLTPSESLLDPNLE
jgi:hypothetical protein